MLRLSLERAPRAAAPPLWPALAAALWAALAAAMVVLAPAAGVSPATCAFRRVTGVPCPTCGSTRAALALLDGRPLAAIAFNPMTVALGAAAIAWLALRIGLGRRVALHAGARVRKALWIGAALLIALDWAWVVWRPLAS
jgi:hypothetical protein